MILGLHYEEKTLVFQRSFRFITRTIEEHTLHLVVYAYNIS